MAREEVVTVPRSGRGGAFLLTFILLLITFAALVISWLAVHRANQAVQKANDAISKTQRLSTKVDNALGTLNKASTGAGAGPNNPQPTPSTYALPNANGQ